MSLRKRGGVPQNHCWVLQGPFARPKQHSTSFPVVRAQRKLLWLWLLTIAAFLHWESAVPVSQADRIPLVPSAQCYAGSSSSVCFSGFGALCGIETPHSQGEGALQLISLGPSGNTCSRGDPPFCDSTPFTSIYSVSSVLLRYNMSSQLHFS